MTLRFDKIKKLEAKQMKLRNFSEKSTFNDIVKNNHRIKSIDLINEMKMTRVGLEPTISRLGFLISSQDINQGSF